ncbi:unnamed protein product [Effrenium voratum]|nr:unnamed protein product [Effrenium voratum]
MALSATMVRAREPGCRKIFPMNCTFACRDSISDMGSMSASIDEPQVWQPRRFEGLQQQSVPRRPGIDPAVEAEPPPLKSPENDKEKETADCPICCEDLGRSPQEVGALTYQGKRIERDLYHVGCFTLMLSHKGAFRGERLKDGYLENLKISWGQSPTTRQPVDGFVSMPSMADRTALVSFMDWKSTGRIDVAELATIAAVQLPLSSSAMEGFIRENFQEYGMYLKEEKDVRQAKVDIRDMLKSYALADDVDRKERQALRPLLASADGTEAEHSQGNSTDARRWIREEEKERREAEKEEAALKAKLQAEHERLKKERQADEAELRAEVRREAQEARKETQEKEAQEKKKHEAHKAAAEVFLAAASGKGDTESDESHKSGKSDKAAGSRPSQDDASGVHPSERIREEKERERERREREREAAGLQAELEEEHKRLVKERQAEKAALQAELAREAKEAQEQAKAQKSESPKGLIALAAEPKPQDGRQKQQGERQRQQEYHLRQREENRRQQQREDGRQERQFRDELKAEWKHEAERLEKEAAELRQELRKTEEEDAKKEGSTNPSPTDLSAATQVHSMLPLAAAFSLALTGVLVVEMRRVPNTSGAHYERLLDV